MKRKTKYILILIFSFHASFLMSQNIEEDIIQNVIAYHLRNALQYDLGLENGNYLQKDITSIKKMFNCFGNLSYELDTLDNIKYPIPNYTIYSFTMRGFNCSTNDSVMSFFRINSLYPNDYYLIAVKNDGKDIKYLSGAFFQTRISDDFNLEENNPESFYDYLKIKGYRYGLKEVLFKKIKKDIMFFEAYSDFLNEKKVEIEVSTSNKDVINFKIQPASACL